MNEKHVLIIDDDSNMAFMLATALERLGKDYKIEIAHSGEEALNKTKNTSFDLIITDYNMPGMNGVEIVKVIRKISPETLVVMMTAYGSRELHTALPSLNVHHYLDKPFNIAEIQQIVKNAVEKTQRPELDKLSINLDNNHKEINRHLKTLLVNTGAWSVLLVSTNGYPIATAGQVTTLNVPNISALVAANFMAATELANMLGNTNSIFKSSYHEGNDYNIYAYKVNDDLLITVIFSIESKPGLIWFYTKQTATDLLPVVEAQSLAIGIVDDQDIDIDSSFDDLFGDDMLDDNFLKEDDIVPNKPNTTTAPKPAVPSSSKNNKPISYQEAVASGLVPKEISKRETQISK